MYCFMDFNRTDLKALQFHEIKKKSSTDEIIEQFVTFLRQNKNNIDI